MKNSLVISSLIRFQVVAFLVAIALLSIASLASAETAPLTGCAKIMPLGDSITLGVNGGYRNDLFTALQKDNCGATYVGTVYDQYTRVADKYHEGHSGFTITDIVGNVNAWLSATQPNIITLMIGTNDIAWWTAENAEQIGARHNALIDQLQHARPDAWIFVASIPPQSSQIIQPNNVDRALLATQFNIVVRRNAEMRAAAGQKVRFVDVNSVLSTSDLYDGIHPTEAAHAKVAQKFLEGIHAAMTQTSAPTPPAPAPTPAPPSPTPQPPAASPAPAQTTPASTTVTPPDTSPAASSSTVSPTIASSPPQNGGGGSTGLALVFALLGFVLWRSREADTESRSRRAQGFIPQ